MRARLIATSNLISSYKYESSLINVDTCITPQLKVVLRIKNVAYFQVIHDSVLLFITTKHYKEECCLVQITVISTKDVVQSTRLTTPVNQR